VAIVEELAPAAITAADADDASSSSSGSQRRVFLAEPVAFYKLDSGDFWISSNLMAWPGCQAQ
jgi:hypothetical protein